VEGAYTDDPSRNSSDSSTGINSNGSTNSAFDASSSGSGGYFFRFS
jgi:hypothetical protein